MQHIESNLMEFDFKSGKLVPVKCTGTAEIGDILQWQGYDYDRLYVIDYAFEGRYAVCFNPKHPEKLQNQEIRTLEKRPGICVYNTGEKFDRAKIPEFLQLHKEAKAAAEVKAKEAAAAYAAEKERLKVEYSYLSKDKTPAQNIKAELSRLFPGVKFSCTYRSFSMGNDTTVSWVDGPTKAQVEAVTDKYEHGSFDGMEDLYTYRRSAFLDLFGGAKYLDVERKFRPGLLEAVRAAVAKEYGYHEPLDYHQEETVRRKAWDILKDVDLRGKGDFLKLELVGHDWQAVFETVALPPPPAARPERKGKKPFDIPGHLEVIPYVYREPAAAVPVDRPAPVPVEPGKLVIIDYSEKACAIIGDTKAIKETLKAKGARFNPKLSCGPGWIFPKAKRADYEGLIN